MKDKLLNIKNKHPLFIILVIAMIVRIIAIIFSKGYGLENEYFFYVETPNAWLDNIDNCAYKSPQGISLLYVSINYLIFGFFKLFGISNPQWLMFFSRLIHGTISLTVITLAYRIVKNIAQKRVAINIAWILALLWFMPYISVHTIAQAFSLPFLLYGTLLVVKQEKLRKELKSNNLHRTSFAISGLFFAVGFSLWYFSALYYIAILVVLLARKNLKGVAMSTIGFIITACITLTIPDFVVWGRPFVEFRAFLDNGVDLSYPIGYYILALASILTVWGFLKCNTNNKQVKYNIKRSRLKRYICAFCIFANIILLSITTIMYSNKPEVKAMTYLSKNENVKPFVIQDEFSYYEKHPPIFYEKNWSDYIVLYNGNMNISSTLSQDIDFIIFRGNKDLERRVEEMGSYYPDLKHEVTYKPYFAQIMYKWLNNSKNDGCVSIYKVNHE